MAIDRQVEQNRRAGRGGEAIIGIEDAGEQRLDRHEREIGEGDAGQRHGEIEADRIVGETRREQADHLWREHQRKRQQHEIDGDQRRGDLVGEQLGGGKPGLLQGARIGRNEGRGKGAFGEDGAEMVGQPEGDEEGVGQRPGAQHRGHDHVANEAGEAGDEGEPADRGDASDHGEKPRNARWNRHARRAFPRKQRDLGRIGLPVPGRVKLLAQGPRPVHAAAWAAYCPGLK